MEQTCTLGNSTFTEPKITALEPEKYISYIPRTDLKQFALKKVAVYSRVSRESEIKHHSITMQMKHLEEYAKSHPNWIFTKHYVDEGKTGTKLNRPAFNQMLNDARAGKIDIILTKTVSRFGRNMKEVLKTIRELKELDVTVIFDNEGLSTDNSDTIFELQYQGIQAEVESRQNSEYQKWAIRNRFKEGISTYSRPYGYKMEQGIFKVIPEEASIVKRIFEMYLSGMGPHTISKQLTSEGIPSPHGTRWRFATIRNILRNEKYTGDLLLQKTYRKDFISKKKLTNRGDLPSYLIENEHEAIIDKITFQRVQNEQKRRTKLYQLSHNFNRQLIPQDDSKLSAIKPSATLSKIFTGLINCPYCNVNFRYQFRSGSRHKLWACQDYLQYGKDTCTNKTIPESILIKVTTDVLLSHKLIKKDSSGNLPELTHDLLTRLITKIIAYKDQTLEYHLADGETVMTKWQFKSRKESWTPEMKERARIKALEIIAKRKKEELSDTEEAETSKPTKSQGVAERSEK